MVSSGSIVPRVDDVRRQAEFWAAALDYVPRGGARRQLADRRPSEVQIPPRIHLDLYAEDQAAEVSRLIGLGATEVIWDKRQPGADFVILADLRAIDFRVIDKG